MFLGSATLEVGVRPQLTRNLHHYQIRCQRSRKVSHSSFVRLHRLSTSYKHTISLVVWLLDFVRAMVLADMPL